jgi:pimeloyl-ACP methyl ester carboxylesterase
MSRTAAVLLVLACATMGGCGDSSDDPSAAGSPSASPSASSPADTASASAPIGSGPSGLFEVGDRGLFLECVGSGRPVVVLEPGQGDGRSTYATVQDQLAEVTTVCTYDRANVGQSGPAPTPRTSLDAVEDLRGLLQAAGLEGPYVLAGTSAGGFIALHFARAYPQEVQAVLAINPPPLASQWVDRAYPLLTHAEIAEEKAFYRGDNPESFDWTTSSKLIEGTTPPSGVPMVLLHSTVAQCEGDIGACSKTSDLYVKLGEEYAASWPGARFEAVDLGHQVQEADPEKVTALIRALLAPS